VSRGKEKLFYQRVQQTVHHLSPFVVQRHRLRDKK